MDELAITTTRDPEEMVAELVSKCLWLFFACTTIGLVILVETLILNKGCAL